MKLHTLINEPCVKLMARIAMYISQIPYTKYRLATQDIIIIWRWVCNITLVICFNIDLILLNFFKIESVKSVETAVETI